MCNNPKVDHVNLMHIQNLVRFYTVFLKQIKTDRRREWQTEGMTDNPISKPSYNKLTIPT